MDQRPASIQDEIAGWLGLAAALFGLAGIGGGALILGHHALRWLATGTWPGATVSDGLQYGGYGHPQTHLVGLQRVFDWIMGLQLWLALPVFTILVLLLAFWLGDAIATAQREANKKAAVDKAAMAEKAAEKKAEPPKADLSSGKAYRFGRLVRRIAQGWLWPRSLRSETTVAIRAGRVLHWLFVLIAAVPAAIALYVLLFTSEGGAFWAFLGFGGFALGIAMIGRGLRYILSGE